MMQVPLTSIRIISTLLETKTLEPHLRPIESEPIEIKCKIVHAYQAARRSLGKLKVESQCLGQGGATGRISKKCHDKVRISENDKESNNQLLLTKEHTPNSAKYFVCMGSLNCSDVSVEGHGLSAPGTKMESNN